MGITASAGKVAHMHHSLDGGSCGSDRYLDTQVKADPSLMDRISAVHHAQQSFAAAPQHQSQLQKSTWNYVDPFVPYKRRLAVKDTVHVLQGMESPPVTIPVYFHVIYFDDVGNVDNVHLYNAIQNLNKDFNGKSGGNMGITFTWSETDLYRRAWSKTGVYGQALLEFEEHKFTKRGGHDVHEPEKYLNIWITEIYDPQTYGYSSYPGMHRSRDGITLQPFVVDPDAWRLYLQKYGQGNFVYNQGRITTLTHEVGHWCGLRHTYDPSEQIVDTPFQTIDMAGMTSPMCECEAQCHEWNFMDFTRCPRMFTHGQVALAKAVFTYNPNLQEVDAKTIALDVDTYDYETLHKGYRWQMAAPNMFGTLQMDLYMGEGELDDGEFSEANDDLAALEDEYEQSGRDALLDMIGGGDDSDE
eukprot:191501_1